MLRAFAIAFLAALLAALLWTTALGQAGLPPGVKPPKTNKPPLATKAQPARQPMPPPGPKPEDILKLLFPPEPAGDEDVESAPRRGSAGPSVRAPMTVSQSDQKPSVPSDSEVRRMSAKQQQSLLRQAVSVVPAATMEIDHYGKRPRADRPINAGHELAPGRVNPELDVAHIKLEPGRRIVRRRLCRIDEPRLQR